MFLCDVPPYSAECLFDWCELGQFLYETSSSWAICERWKVASFMAALCLHLPGMVCSCHSDGEGHDRPEQQGSQLGGVSCLAVAVGITRATVLSEDLANRSDGPSSERDSR